MVTLAPAPKHRERQWRAWRLRAWLRLALVAGLLTAWPAAMAVWTLTALLAAGGWIPAWLGGVAGVVAAVAGGAVVLGTLRRRFRRAPIDVITSQALLWRAGGAPPTLAVARTFWWRQMRGVVRDPYWAMLGLALVFAVTINTVSLWQGPVGAMVGVPYERQVRSQEPLVRLLAVAAHSPLDGRTYRIAANDGFLEVDEGAIVRWRVLPLRAATTVVLAAGERQWSAPVTADGTATFALAATVPQTYRFSLRRWGVVWTEAWARRLDVRPDLPPEPRWIKPPPAQPPSDRLLTFDWRAEDDRALTAVWLEARGEDAAKRIDLWRGEGTTAAAGPTTAWVDLDELPPGDQIVLTLVAQDNDAIAGPNEGRSEPAILRVRDARARHEDWRASLAVLLERGVEGLAQAWTPAGLHNEVAQDLAARAAALADEAARIPEASFAARDALIAIARDWRAAVVPAQRAVALQHAEDAVWATDRLLGREEAAGIEAQQDRLIRRLEDLAGSLDNAGDADLQRLLELLQREMAELARAMQSKRPQLPTELIQKDALRSEDLDSNADRMQSLHEALRNGDRDAAKQQLASLLEDLRQMREAMSEGAQQWMQQDAPSMQALQERLGKLDALRERQTRLAEQAAAAEAGLYEAQRRASQAMRRAGADEQSARAVAQQAREAALRGDWGTVGEALNQMSRADRAQAEQALRELARASATSKQLARNQRALQDELSAAGIDDGGVGAATLREAVDEAKGEMQAAAESLEGAKPGAAEHGFRAADALGRAAGSMRQLAKGMQQMRQSPGYGPRAHADAGERDGDALPHEPFEAPEAGAERNRSEVLQGFRHGLPDAGRDINERYLDRLLH